MAELIFPYTAKIKYKPVFITILLLCTCFFPAFPLEDKEIPPGADIVRTLETRTYLRHDWKYIAGDNPDYALLSYDDSNWESIDFPTFTAFNIDTSYYFWFRKTFYVSENLKGEALGYVSSYLPSATELYLNGSLIGTSGRMPPGKYFDASYFPRSYKNAWTIDKAVSFIQEEKGGHFDPGLVDAFMKILQEIKEIKKSHLDS